MKNIKFLLAAMVIGSFLISGCNKDEEPTPTTPTDTTTNQQPYTSSMTAKIDGVAFTATVITKMIQNSDVVISGSNTVKAITMKIDTTLSTGTYSASSNDVYCYFSVSSSMYTGVSGSGTCVITKFDKTNKIIEATFSFDAQDLMGSNPDVSITDGVLKVKYQ